MGGIKNAFFKLGFDTTNARLMMAHALVMGDSWETGWQDSAWRMDFRSGAGRFRAHWPYPDDLVSPSGWDARATYILPGQSITWPVGDSGPEPAELTMFKWAGHWTSSNLSVVPDIDFYVDDVCVNPPELVAWDNGYDPRIQIRIERPNLANRCLQMRAYAYSVPSSGYYFYSSSYFHSGPVYNH
jgi:hypothetical protein